jgi:quercetin 2,3-dioxygenase
MSGPVATDDVPPAPDASAGTKGPVVELEPGRVAQVGTLPARRVLPRRARRTVGAWCFA